MPDSRQSKQGSPDWKIPTREQIQKNLSIDELHQLQKDQNKTRAEAAGFHEDTTEQEAKDLLANTIIEAGMSLGKSSHQMPSEADHTRFPAVH